MDSVEFLMDGNYIKQSQIDNQYTKALFLDVCKAQTTPETRSWAPAYWNPKVLSFEQVYEYKFARDITSTVLPKNKRKSHTMW